MREVGLPDEARRPVGVDGSARSPEPTTTPDVDGASLAPLVPGMSPARALAIQRAVGNAAFARAVQARQAQGPVVQRAPEILFPRDRERIRQPDYTIHLRPDPDTDNMRVDVDNTGFQGARPAGGSWWFDWSGFTLGQHTLTAEAWNQHGQRQVTPPRNVYGIAGTPVTVTNVGAAQVINGRVEAAISYQAGAAAGVATLNISHARHLVEKYVTDPDSMPDAAVTTLVDLTLPAFLQAFSDYAVLIGQALGAHGLALRPLAPEFRLQTPSTVWFHSDTLYVGAGVHCFPTAGPANIVTVLGNANDYVRFKHLMRAYAYTRPGVLATKTPQQRATARARATASLGLLGSDPGVAGIFQRRGIANEVAYQAQVIALL